MKKAPTLCRDFWPVYRQPVNLLVEFVFFLVHILAIVVAKMQWELGHTFPFENTFNGFEVQSQRSFASVARKRGSLMLHGTSPFFHDTITI